MVALYNVDSCLSVVGVWSPRPTFGLLPAPLRQISQSFQSMTGGFGTLPFAMQAASD